MTEILTVASLRGIVPLEETMTPGPCVPDALSAALLEGDGTLMAVLDGAKLLGLQEMCGSYGIAHKCLYTGSTFDELGDVAPWLVALAPDGRMLRNLMTQGDAPWHLWARQTGIFVRSTHPFEDVWAHLRKFTLVPDENGDRLFFRFFEPDFITTVLQVCDPGELVSFFAKIDRLIAIERHWPDVWSAAVSHPGPPQDIRQAPFVLTERKLRAMQKVDHIRRARKACIDHGVAPEDREACVALAVWLQAHKHTHDKHWVEAFGTFRQLDAAQLDPIWKIIADGQYSMGYILYEVRQQFGLERPQV